MLVSTHNLGSVTDILRLHGHGQRYRAGKRPDGNHLYRRESRAAPLAACCATWRSAARKIALLPTMNAPSWHVTVSGAEGRKMSVLLEPFGYEYMLNAMWVSAMVGGLCAFPLMLSDA